MTVAMDPRLRARRAEVARRRSWRRIAAAGVIGVAVVVGAAAWPLLHSRLLAARVITVTGARHTAERAILAASGLEGHPPMIDVNAGQVARRIEALPWVATATVSRRWPDGVHIAVTERSPVAVAPRAAGGWAVIDATGRILADVDTAPATLPRLDGVSTRGVPGRWLPPASRPALAVAAALPVALRAAVRGVAVEGGAVSLDLAGGVTAQIGAPSQLRAKFEDIAAILAGAVLPPHAVIDVGVPQSPAVSAS